MGRSFGSQGQSGSGYVYHYEGIDDELSRSVMNVKAIGDIEYIPADKFVAYCNAHDITGNMVVGHVFMKPGKASDDDPVVMFGEKAVNLKQDSVGSAIVGYICVGDDSYVSFSAPAAKAGGIFPLVASVLLVAAILCGALFFMFKNMDTNAVAKDGLDIEDGADWDGSMPTNGKASGANTDSIEIPGYANLYVTKSNPNVQLINPTENTVYFVYDIKEGDKVIYSTKALPPDRMVEVPLGELLDVGEHDLTFAISCYDVEDQSGCNGANQSVKVTVEAE